MRSSLPNDHDINVAAYVLKKANDTIEKAAAFPNPYDLEQFFELIPIDNKSTPWNAILSQPHSKIRSCCCKQILNDSRTERIVGFVFKPRPHKNQLRSQEPYSQADMTRDNERRSFVKRLSAHFPTLPIQEEESHQTLLQNRLLIKMFAHARMKALFQQGWSISKLWEFHQRQKDIIRGRSEKLYRDIETLVSRILIYPLELVEKQYQDLFIRASLA
jgi:hypothetical protein